MDDKGANLNKRVWKLFEDAGFQTKPNSNNPAEEVIMLSQKKWRTVDLFVSEKKLGFKIIGWNKARKELKESLTVHIHDYQQLLQKAEAKSVLFVSTEKEITEDDKQYAQQHGMRVWGEEDLRYYETLVDTIGPYAKYEIIHSFGVQTIEEKSIHTALAICLHQPFSHSDAKLFLFTMPPEKLLKTCSILRKASGNAEAYQRMLRKSRLGNIRNFVTQDHALLPPNIIVHFGPKVTWDSIPIPEKNANNRPITLSRERDYELVVLNIPMEYSSLELIDGQHRLYGFAEAEPATKESFNLVVLGMNDLSLEKRRDVFVSINDTARRVDPNLVAYLKYTDDEAKYMKDSELMAIKIAVEFNKISPFKHKIRLIDIGDQTITLKGFSGYDLIGLIGPRGLLRKYYSNRLQDYIGALRLYFNFIKSTFENEWKHPEKYIIFTNRGISAFLKLLKSILKTCQSQLDQEILIKYLQALKNNWQGSWETRKLKNSYIGSKGWKDFHRDLVTTIRNVYPEFKE